MVTLSTTLTDIAGPGLREIQEQQGWEDFLEWCRREENGQHE